MIISKGINMIQEQTSRLQDCLEKQLAAYEEIYLIAVSLNELCSQEPSCDINEEALNSFLQKRQKLMLAAEKTHQQIELARKSLQDALKPTGTLLEGYIEEHEDAVVLKRLYRRLKHTLSEVIALDKSTQENLSQQRDYFKQKLLDLQKSKKAGKAYSSPKSQTEGYFIDIKKK